MLPPQRDRDRGPALDPLNEVAFSRPQRADRNLVVFLARTCRQERHAWTNEMYGTLVD